ncbi:MAG: HAMP domain-containing protein [Prolixibacteraceae bacterium]
MKNLSLRNKLFMVSGVVIVSLLFVIYTSLNGISTFNTSQKKLFEVEYPTTLNLSKLSIDLARERFTLRRMLEASIYTEKVSWHQELMELKNDINEKVIVVQKLSGDLPKIQAYLKDFTAVRDSYLIMRDEEIIPAIYQRSKSKEELDLMLGPQTKQSDIMRQQIFAASTISEERNNQIMNDSKAEAERLTLIFIIVGIIVTIFALLATIYLVQITANPIKELSKISTEVAYGDLSINIPPQNRTDEVGVLWLSFNMMVGTLRSVTGETRQIVTELLSETASLNEIKDPASLTETIGHVQEKIEKLGKVLGEYKL